MASHTQGQYVRYKAKLSDLVLAYKDVSQSKEKLELALEKQQGEEKKERKDCCSLGRTAACFTFKAESLVLFFLLILSAISWGISVR